MCSDSLSILAFLSEYSTFVFRNVIREMAAWFLTAVLGSSYVEIAANFIGLEMIGPEDLYNAPLSDLVRQFAAISLTSIADAKGPLINSALTTAEALIFDWDSKCSLQSAQTCRMKSGTSVASNPKAKSLDFVIFSSSSQALAKRGEWAAVIALCSLGERGSAGGGAAGVSGSASQRRAVDPVLVCCSFFAFLSSPFFFLLLFEQLLDEELLDELGEGVLCFLRLRLLGLLERRSLLGLDGSLER